MDPHTLEQRKLLVARVGRSSLLARSVRLQELLSYLAKRVLEDGAEQIHEQEVGHRVFGRAPEYDTAADNIVRVHASTLRKRLEQFFAEEGSEEPVLMEIPKGNYAPVFRERSVIVADAPVPGVPETQPSPPPRSASLPLRIAVLSLSAATLFLGWRLWTGQPHAEVRLAPPVNAFWSAIFVPGERTDVVLDDGALALYQELDGRPVGLSSYFDRSYLRRLNESGGGALESHIAGGILLKRYSSFAGVNLLWPLASTAAALLSEGAVHFARDYSYRELKANRAILLGTRWSNPWIEPFEGQLGIHWLFDKTTAIYYPSDTWATAAQAGRYRPAGEHPDGFCSIDLVSNLGGTGRVLILSATGGAAANAAEAYLLDGGLMEQLRRRLPGAGAAFPAMEVLLRVPSRSRLPKDCEVVVCRVVK